MKETLLKQDIIMADETSIQVLREDGKAPESKSFMWVYRSGRYGPSIGALRVSTISGAGSP